MCTSRLSAVLGTAIVATGLSLMDPTVSYGAYSFTKPNANEANVADVLEHVYGGRFTSSGADFTSADLTARRLADESDQLWEGEYVGRIVARFSGYTQTFGTLSSDSFTPLAEAAEEGYAPDAGDLLRLSLTEPTTLARAGNSGTHSSRESDNVDVRDHMISYAIDGVSASPTWLLFWEDLNVGPGVTRGRSMSDFNDLVVMLRMADSGVTPVAVPLPPAFGVGLVSLVAGAWFGRRWITGRHG